MSDVLALEAHLSQPPTTVYKALTDAGALRVWLAEHAEVSLPTTYTFWGKHTPQGKEATQRLLSSVPDKELSFTWPLDNEETTVTLSLSPTPDGTALRLQQTNLPTLAELMDPPGRRDGRHSMHTFWR